MEALLLTRKEMADVLLSLKGDIDKSPLGILQESWLKNHKRDVEHGQSLQAFVSTSLPVVFERLIKSPGKNVGFSLNDIVALSNQIEHCHVSSTTMQNWVKRDVKELIGTPKQGKKYSIEQVATLFIVEDLKTTLDFESIRKLLQLVFNDPDDHDDDLIHPLQLYSAYATIFEDLDVDGDQIMDAKIAQGLTHEKKIEQVVLQRARDYTSLIDSLETTQKEAISNIIVIATLAVQTSYFQSLAKRYLNATLFLQNLIK